MSNIEQQVRQVQQQVYKTKLGVLIWPHLTKARQYKGKGEASFDTGFGTGPFYADRLARKDEKPADVKKRLADEADTFAAQIDEWLNLSSEYHKLEPRPAPYGPLVEKVDGVKTEVEGATHFKMKVPEKVKTRKGDTWERKPKLFDANGHPITGDLNIGGGTLAVVKYRVYLTKGNELAGVRLEPTAVMIVKLVEGGAGDTFESFDTDEYEIDAFDASDLPTGDF